ncbi:MAG: glutathione S-transferase family protein [Pirellulaceae bacterium]|nr:glutathione S-transferase family protein [Pirellulaceae bacterium]
MSKRKLIYGPGSPFARTVRIVLAEKGLDFEPIQRPPEPDESPTLQVPTLVDGELVLWDSDVILEYLMRTYPNSPASPGEKPFVEFMVRSEMEWHDRLTLATLQTLGTNIAVVVQIDRTGVTFEDNIFLSRCAERISHILDWCEERLIGLDDGFYPGVVSIPDVRLACWLGFIDIRFPRLDWHGTSRPKIEALLQRLQGRQSFIANPIPELAGD